MSIASIVRVRHISLSIEIPVKFTDDYDAYSLIRYKSSFPIESRTNYIRYIRRLYRVKVSVDISSQSLKFGKGHRFLDVRKRFNNLSKESSTRFFFRVTVRSFCCNIIEIRDR